MTSTFEDTRDDLVRALRAVINGLEATEDIPGIKERLQEIHDWTAKLLLMLEAAGYV